MPEATDLTRTAVDAWLFGYPLIFQDVTKQRMTGPALPGNPTAPAGRFIHHRTAPDHTYTELVTPNADVLYSMAWLEVGEEPTILSVPEMGDRYWVMQMVDGWSDVFASPGSRTTGQGGGHFAVTGPGWTGTLPGDVAELKSPTSMVWIVGRVNTAGSKDHPAVHALQDRMYLTPLSAWTGDPKDYTPPARTAASPTGSEAGNIQPVDEIAAMDGTSFFARLNELMVADPPHPADAPALERFSALGVAPGGGRAGLERPEVINAIHAAPAGGLSVLRDRVAEDERIAGWKTYRNLGAFGTDYTTRALISFLGGGGNLAADALYFRAGSDADGQAFTGQDHYVLHFDAGKLPPVRGFWSLSMYNDKLSFVDNPLHRYIIGDRDELSLNPDGSLDILIQHDRPAPDRQNNWLPAPTGAFNIVMRLYWPEQPLLDGSWTPPPVRKA
ncbi:DUF1254 domain-containing protein [Actinocorallia sp. B10E7]|uniref:DUF1254 domain-containing protein n=1 Tax=Actinocorallia sp. B10E7 TaxID=3153558 RepID=UPI00325D7479